MQKFQPATSEVVNENIMQQQEETYLLFNSIFKDWDSYFKMKKERTKYSNTVCL